MISEIISQAIYYLSPNISIVYKKNDQVYVTTVKTLFHILIHFSHTFNHSTLQVNICIPDASLHFQTDVLLCVKICLIIIVCPSFLEKHSGVKLLLSSAKCSLL